MCELSSWPEGCRQCNPHCWWSQQDSYVWFCKYTRSWSYWCINRLKLNAFISQGFMGFSATPLCYSAMPCSLDLNSQLLPGTFKHNMDIAILKKMFSCSHFWGKRQIQVLYGVSVSEGTINVRLLDEESFQKLTGKRHTVLTWKWFLWKKGRKF